MLPNSYKDLPSFTQHFTQVEYFECMINKINICQAKHVLPADMVCGFLQFHIISRLRLPTLVQIIELVYATKNEVDYNFWGVYLGETRFECWSLSSTGLPRLVLTMFYPFFFFFFFFSFFLLE